MPEFSVITVNTFGLPMYVGWGRLGRLAVELNRLGPAAICVQEIQQSQYVARMKRCLPSYPYAVYQPHWYAPKGGLMTFSRLPLTGSAGFRPFPNRGRLLSIGWSDWTLQKGVLVAEADVSGQKMVVLNAHLQANYSATFGPNRLFGRIQLDQVRHLAELVCAQPADAVVIACGDYNFPRNTQMYRELISRTGFSDPLAEDPRPTYRAFPYLPARWNLSLDFVLYRAPELPGLWAEADIIPIEDTSATSPIRRFLTDHCALALRLAWDGGRET